MVVPRDWAGFICIVLFGSLSVSRAEEVWQKEQLPLTQSANAGRPAARIEPFTLRDAARDDRWLGLGVRSVRWSPDGEFVYFRWDHDPQPEEDPESDPWYRVSRDDSRVERVPDGEVSLIPAADLVWDSTGRRVAWVDQNRLFVWDREGGVRLLYSGPVGVEHPHFSQSGSRLNFQLGQDLYQCDLSGGSVRQLTRSWTADQEKDAVAQWLERQQLDLFERHRHADRLRQERSLRERLLNAFPVHPIPVDAGWKIERITISPEGRFLTVVYVRPVAKPRPTHYLDFAAASGYAEVQEARPKVGEAQPGYRLGVIPYQPESAPEDLRVIWVEGPEDDKGTIPFGPWWNPEGDRALVQFVSLGFKDRWIGLLELESGEFTTLVHDHDAAWLGGPPPVVGYLNPALTEWLTGGSFVFASERSGWSHLYRCDPNGQIQPLTAGAWEVRGATLSRDRKTWLLQASREHPGDDHLYLMPARGGELIRVTRGEGRFEGWLSPDAGRIAVMHSETVQLPELLIQDAKADVVATRVTQSGTDAFYSHRLVRPEVVNFPHPDGRPVWAALYLPPEDSRNRAAVLHIHGGGYRQFSHRGWSVYGWEMHLGLIHYLVEQGYVVLDFDYRGGAGYGRDYRTDIYRSMGEKDVLGAVGAVDYLARQHGVNPGRVGIYGLSYGGFFTLSALFRHPGVFAAGVANASVSDWAHYNHPWTARVLNLPSEDPEAYRASSPIYFAEGLEDQLLIVHGLIDDNVQFQDSARLIQRLIELEKTFEVMIYPLERHVIRSESSRYDYVRRVDRFFRRHLLQREE